MELRPYQQEAVEAVEEGWKEHDKQLLVCPTGGGKTIIFSKIAKDIQPERTLILCHREELLGQAIDKLRKATGINAGLERAEDSASLNDPVVVSSVQTMVRRLPKWGQKHFDLVIADEGHHITSDIWQNVVNHFDPHAGILGVTATPSRADKRHLGLYYDHIPYEITMKRLIDEGYLCPITVQKVPIEIDLNKVKKTQGDLNAGQLGHAVEPYLAIIAKHLKDHCVGRKILVFLPLIETSQSFVRECRNLGIKAEHIDGTSEDRKELLQRFAQKDFSLLSNANLLTEGFDDPSIDCVVILRPTLIPSFYMQMVGRGTRIAPGKSDLLLLDFMWLSDQNMVCRPASLICGDPEVEEMVDKAIESGEAIDLCEAVEAASIEKEAALKKALEDAKARREEAQRRANMRGQSSLITPHQQVDDFALLMDAVHISQYEPLMNWERMPPSEKQMAVLLKAGFTEDAIKTKGLASKILSVLMPRWNAGLATLKQVKYLKKLGHLSPLTATFQQATEFLNARWRR